jgi:TolB-like protein
LSYASQDAQAAQRICEALRAAGIEVWFDQSELRGGDAWDRKIREQIHDCRLFIPVISANSEHRDEGYFRREWSLAVDRTRDMAHKRAFLLPVVIDDTPERGASVPEKFHELQWTRLPNGETPPAFVERIQRLLSPTPIRTPASAQSGAVGAVRTPGQAAWSPKRTLLVAVAVVVLGAVGYFAIETPWVSKSVVSLPTTAASVAPAAFNPPPHSIAVLPFVNISGDKDQEYFSDGLSEELLNSLARINELQVAARTSSFYFKGEHTDLATIARKLNVAAVLEGSVRRSGNTVRVTTQLINAVTGFHLWSETYDRNLDDVLKIETEIANAIAAALKVTLLEDVAAKIELGGTRNPDARDAYLKATKAHFAASDKLKDEPPATALYSEAIRLDPNYALAFAGRSISKAVYASALTGPALRDVLGGAYADARRAIALASELAEGHLALALYYSHGALEFSRAKEEYEMALKLAPGNARVLRDYGEFAVLMGRTDAGIVALRRAEVLDPLFGNQLRGDALYHARRYDEALVAYQTTISLNPDPSYFYAFRGIVYYALEDLANARSSCEIKPKYSESQWCLAIVYDKLGRRTDAESALGEVKALLGNLPVAYEYAQIYAQWGDTARALEVLEKAWRLRDPELVELKTDPLMDPLRKEPHFQAIERALKFPN